MAKVYPVCSSFVVVLSPAFVLHAIDAGPIPRDYRHITVPVLALFPVPFPPDVKGKQREPRNGVVSFI